MKARLDCYGKMFPDIIPLARNQTVAGKVFGYRTAQSGLAVTQRIAIANHAEWQGCLECHDWDGCYRLSIGSMLMQIAVKG